MNFRCYKSIYRACTYIQLFIQLVICFTDLDDSVTGDNVEQDDDEELISDEDEDEDEEYDKYPDPDYLLGHKKRRNSETSELSKVSAAEEETSVLNGDHALETMTNYDLDPKHEVFGDAGDQTEEISDENKSIVWFLVKQVRPGMDLSKVVLPTFILEPRSFLDKISDYYYHADLLSM